MRQRTGGVGVELIGRSAELAAVSGWVDVLADGPAGLVIRGEAGIGKSSLWSAACAGAGERGARVLLSRPVEAEFALGYAGLGDLLLGVGEPLIARLPVPQARAIGVALSLATDPEPINPLLVGRAVVGLLRELATMAPVVVAIDDVQWLDVPSARVLAFAARRLRGVPVGFALALRRGHDDPLDVVGALEGRTVEIALEGLSLGAVGHLVRSVDPDVSRRRLLAIHERSEGNPFFALELARPDAAAEGLPPTLQAVADRRLRSMAAVARTAVERVAVLGPLPVTGFVDPAALDAAVTAAVLVEQGGAVRFSHPLLAAGAYERVPPARRRQLHREAAAIAVSLEDRARHLALASAEPDAAIAAMLDEAARLARARGAPETAADLAAEARRLTPAEDEADRLRRVMDQAEYLYVAADEVGARTLVTELLAGQVRGEVRVRALVQQALTALDPRGAVGSLEAAVAEPQEDAVLAVRALTQLAWQRGAWLGDLEPAIHEAATALQRAETLGDEQLLVAALTTSGLLLSIAGRPGAAERFGRAVEILGRNPIAAGDHTPRLAYAAERRWRGAFAAAEQLVADERVRAEDQGDEGLLLRLNVFGAELALRRGRWDEAEQLLDDAVAEAMDYWRVSALILRAILRARRGDERAADDADAVRASPAAGTDPSIAAAADVATAVIDHAAGRIEVAADRLVRLAGPQPRGGARFGEFAMTIPDIATVLAEAGRVDEILAFAEELEGRAGQLAPWGDAAAAYCRGLIALAAAQSDEALVLLSTAAAAFTELGASWEAALARLAEGSVLRRAGRRRDAAARLEQAIAIFERLGAAPSLERARDELRRARPRPRTDDRLTAAESRVAGLVASGLTNREVASRLFTTVATVEAHLTRIYAKLGLRSRTELARRVSDGSLAIDPELVS